MDLKYLKLLAKEYKNSQEVMSEIINLSTILTLPKGTEFFFSDLHGEYESFIHMLKSASGVIKNKIDLLYKNKISERERQHLAHLIYYPQKHLNDLDIIKIERNQWYEKTIYQLINVAKFCSTKYTQSKINKKLPKEYAYVITEMLNCHNDQYIKSYYHDIIQAIIEIDNAEKFITALCYFIQDVCIDYIHVIGDIYDRGPRPDIIMNELKKYDQVDIQWGNHDISWIGAACGNQALMANVIRIALSYNHFDLLEDGYGINLRALSDFASETYREDPCEAFMPHILDENKYDLVDKKLTAKMHKAIAIIQFKLEGQLLQRHPEYQMNHLQWLKQINYKEHTVFYLGKQYVLKDNLFPTVNAHNPLLLTDEEKQLMKTISTSFKHSQKLHEHIQFLYAHGGMYKILNNNLMYHGCIPMNENGTLREVMIRGKKLRGRELLDYFEEIVNKAYFSDDESYQDDIWYLWCSKDSPVFGKSKLAIFEKYFICDQKLQKERMDPYYQNIESENICKMILSHFGIDENKGHIINGHVPVKLKEGESPIKGNGRLYVIDGGLSKAYHSKTGIAGYTLIYDSQHIQLASHRPYNKEIKEGNSCLTTNVEIIESTTRIKNKDCDLGKVLQEQKRDLKQLLELYQKGIIKEK